MLRAIGIVRKVDELGRLVLPKELRKSLNIEVGTPLEILADEKGIYIRKYEVGCTFCRNMEGLVEFGGTQVCKACAKAILGK